MAAPSAPTVDKETFKANSRDSRLRMTNRLEERIAEEFRKQALVECDPAVKAYWVCRQDHGLMVVFKCQDESARMKACVSDFTSRKEVYEAYKTKRAAEIHAESAAARAAYMASLPATK